MANIGNRLTHIYTEVKDITSDKIRDATEESLTLRLDDINTETVTEDEFLTAIREAYKKLLKKEKKDYSGTWVFSEAKVYFDYQDNRQTIHVDDDYVKEVVEGL